MIIAIDGPSGSGKSSVARKVAERLGFVHIDSGAIYRAIALAALERGVPLDDGAALEDLTERLDLRIDSADGHERVLLDGRDVSEAIREPAVSAAVSRVATQPGVREQVTALVREFARGRDVVTDGRDATTVIFPNAELKVFLDADAAERARRRTEELAARGTPQPFEAVLTAIRERDRRDTHRSVGALKRASDALVIDTTALALEEVVERVVEAARARMGSRTVDRAPRRPTPPPDLNKEKRS